MREKARVKEPAGRGHVAALLYDQNVPVGVREGSLQAKQAWVRRDLRGVSAQCPPPASGPGLFSCQDHLSPVTTEGHKLLGLLAPGCCCSVGVGSSRCGGHTAWLDRGPELVSDDNSLVSEGNHHHLQGHHDSSGYRPGLAGPK